MDLKQLLDAMNAAKAAWDADQKNTTLKAAFETAEKAYNEAKAASTESDEDEDPPGEEDESKWDEKTKAHIAKLRSENAKHRTKNKELNSKVKSEQDRVKAILKAAGIESEDEKPEEQVKNLTNTTNELAFRNVVLEMAVDHGIPSENVKYFQFLIQDRTAGLEEGEELSEDDLAAIVKEAKGRSGKKATTTVGSGKPGSKEPAPATGDEGEITLDQFCSMSITEKSKLYEKNPDTYESLAKAAKAQRRLI